MMTLTVTVLEKVKLMLSGMDDYDFAVEYCTNMISVHASAYVIFYDVRILQLSHILHFFLCFAFFRNCFFNFVAMATDQINKFKSHFGKSIQLPFT